MLVVLALLAPIAGWLLVRASLPTLDGSLSLAGLTEPVTVERDADGVPTVHARDRDDCARALGFLHAQDRFFQMDLLRRQGAGELSELFGPLTLTLDQEARQHLYRRRAAAVVQAITPDHLRQVDAYVAGVNAGLAALGARPWESLALRAAPRPWTREDCVLVIDAMATSLETDGSDERSRLAIAQTYDDETLNFLRPLVTEQSAALDGSTAPAPPVPAAEHWAARPFAPDEAPPVPVLTASTDSADPELLPGSNAFVLSGKRSAGGGALVANDPHLRLAVPNIWYRASLALPDLTATGTTLPGVPGIVLGSNGHVAWGFTNGYVDTCDLVRIETDPADAGRYRVPDGSGWEPFEVVREVIGVHGRAPETCEVLMTRWGPLITRPGKGRPVYARHWSEYEPGGLNFQAADLMNSRSVDETLAIAHRSGIHPQNIMVGDRDGNVAWTIIGRVPRRVGFDGLTPQSWADGTRRWDGFLPPEQVPVIRNPADGQLWTANNRVLGGEGLALLGDGGYASAERAGQIRDRLSALSGRAAKPADGLAVQLDDEALYLARWRELLLQTLGDAAVEKQPDLDELREILRTWDGHASVNAAGYRLLREFRRIVTTTVLNPIMEPVHLRDPVARMGFNVEQPLWSILATRPAYLLPASAASWDHLFLRAAHLTAKLGEQQQPVALSLSECTWGRVNVLAMKHPLSGALPTRFARWLDMPAQELPGDTNMPRVQSPTFGASMRMVVSPGREREGIYEQPGGASGHPFSNFYRAGHDHWTDGTASPFLPGPAKYRLELRP